MLCVIISLRSRFNGLSFVVFLMYVHFKRFGSRILCDNLMDVEAILLCSVYVDNEDV